MHAPLAALNHSGLVTGVGGTVASCGGSSTSGPAGATGAPYAGIASRGFGVELEITTSEGGVTALSNGTDELRTALHKSIREGGGGGASTLRERCLLWTVSTDALIEGVPLHLAQHVLAHAVATQPELAGAASKARALAMLTLAEGTHRSEIKSPAPPNELRFEASAEAEIATVFEAASRLGAAAPSVSSLGRAATALHCHVNVRNAAAGGELLSVRELLNVWLGWVRFDLVTARLARPWTWCDASSSPMFATGVESSSNGAGPAWLQGEAKGARVGGADEWPMATTDANESLRAMIERLNTTLLSRTPSSPTSHEPPCLEQQPTRMRRALGIQGLRWNGTRRCRMAGDVVAFLTRVHLLWHSAAFAALSEESKLARLFEPELRPGGVDTPNHHLGRQCSLNLHRVCSYGTIEFRRFHSTLDPRLATSWCRFCVGFVDAFRRVDSVAAFLEPDMATGLAALRREQESASLSELLESMPPSEAESILGLWRDACP